MLGNDGAQGPVAWLEGPSSGPLKVRGSPLGSVGGCSVWRAEARSPHCTLFSTAKDAGESRGAVAAAQVCVSQAVSQSVISSLIGRFSN